MFAFNQAFVDIFMYLATLKTHENSGTQTRDIMTNE